MAIHWFLKEETILNELLGPINRGSIIFECNHDEYLITIITPIKRGFASDRDWAKECIKKWDFSAVSENIYRRRRRIFKSEDEVIPLSVIEGFKFNYSIINMGLRNTFTDDNENVNITEIRETLENSIKQAKLDLEMLSKL